jgi:outer membrane protein OmpA-like peptidoglycan-associated protein/osmotically-inducible protein OsmY
MAPEPQDRADRWWLAPATLGIVGLPALWGAGMRIQGPKIEADIEARTRNTLASQYPELDVDVDGRGVALWGRLPSDADGRNAAALVSSLRGVDQVTVRYWTPPPATGHTVEVTALPGGFTVVTGALPTQQASAAVTAAARARATATIDSGLTVSSSVAAVDETTVDGFAQLVSTLPRTATSPVTARWDIGGIHLSGTVSDPVQRTALVQAAEAIGLPIDDTLVVRREQPAPRPAVEAGEPATTTPATALPPEPDTPPLPPLEVVVADGRTVVRGSVADDTSRAAVVFFMSAIVGPAQLADELAVDPAAPAVSVEQAIELANRQRPAGPSAEQFAQTVAALAPVTFDIGSTDLDDDQLGQILEIAEVLRTAPAGMRITVVGHSDGLGGEDYNVLISQQRAEAVRVALVFAGIPDSVLSGRAAGSSEPLVDEVTWSDRQANRRVSFEVTPG